MKNLLVAVLGVCCLTSCASLTPTSKTYKGPAGKAEYFGFPLGEFLEDSQTYVYKAHPGDGIGSYEFLLPSSYAPFTRASVKTTPNTGIIYLVEGIAPFSSEAQCDKHYRVYRDSLHATQGGELHINQWADGSEGAELLVEGKKYTADCMGSELYVDVTHKRSWARALCEWLDKCEAE